MADLPRKASRDLGPDEKYSKDYYRCDDCNCVHFVGDIVKQTCDPPQDVGRQAHYEQYDIQPIDFIVQVAGPEWCAGNVIKYLARYKEKNGLEDVKKAKTYCEFLINILEGRAPRDYG